MQSHELQEVGKAKRKRVARGGKRGTYSGRGMNGQKARSGGNVDPLFEGGRSSLTQRMKKLRGFKSPHAKKNVVTLAMLERSYLDGETVSKKTLAEKKLVRNKDLSKGVRIVATGKLTKKLTLADDVTVTENAGKEFAAAPKAEATKK